MLLRARAEEGSGRTDQARQLIGSCLRLEKDLLPAIRDALEYELCAGNWARAWELASAIGSDDIAEASLRYKACGRVKDLDGGVHPLPHRAQALYTMLATYARRGPNRAVADRMAACAIGASSCGGRGQGHQHAPGSGRAPAASGDTSGLAPGRVKFRQVLPRGGRYPA